MKKTKIKSLFILMCLSVITLTLGNYPLLDDQIQNIIEIIFYS